MTYDEPVLTDLGTLQEITEASGFTNEEDGGNKLLVHHLPSGPVSP